MKPLISVVVPIYNVEPYLARCLDSLRSQTYTNLQIILVDDGSPDRCGEICDSYHAKDNRIISLHKSNGGLSDARNYGIDRATGELIAFLDSDDWLPPYHFQKLYDLLVEQNADIAVGNFLRTTDSAAQMPSISAKIYAFTNTEALGQYFTEHYVPMVVACGKLYKRELFKEIRYPSGKLHEDEFTTHQLLFLAHKVAYTTEPLLFYFQRPDSIIGRGFDIRKRIAILEALDERSDFFQQHGLHEYYEKLARSWFLLSFNIDKPLAQHKDLAQVANIKKKRQQLKTRLDQCKLKLRFRVFYQLYYLNPTGFLFFYNLLKNIK